MGELPPRVFISIDGTLVTGKLLVLVPFESPTGTEKNFPHPKPGHEIRVRSVCESHKSIFLNQKINSFS